MEEPVVAYTVKDKLDTIDRRLETFGDTILRLVEKQNDKIEAVSVRIGEIEKVQAGRRAISSHWSAVLAAVGAVGAAVAAVLVAIHG